MARHDRILLAIALWALAMLYLGARLAVDALAWNLAVGGVLLVAMGYDAWAQHRHTASAAGRQADTEPRS